MCWDWTVWWNGFGSFATGVAAVATVVAAVAAIRAGRYAKRAWESQRDAALTQQAATTLLESQWKDELEARKRAQAELVAAWYVGYRWVNGRGQRARVLIRNASDVPIYDGTFRIFDAAIGGAASTLIGEGLLPRVLPPSDEPIPYLLENEDWDQEADLANIEAERVLIEVAFTDTAGARWIRGHRGDLKRMPTLADKAKN